MKLILNELMIGQHRNLAYYDNITGILTIEIITDRDYVSQLYKYNVGGLNENYT